MRFQGVGTEVEDELARKKAVNFSAVAAQAEDLRTKRRFLK